VVIMSAADKRSVFAVPKRAVTYLGTTDTFHSDAETWPPITGADADYLLAAAAARFASPPLGRGDVIAAWSGLRPLVAEEGKSASDTSRRDEVWTGPGGMLSIAGGKLTAYRRMAERVVDQVETALGRGVSRCRTAKTPLPGGEISPDALTAELAEAGVTGAPATRLANLYGSEARTLMECGGGVEAEAVHAVLSEGALTLEDYMVRRSARAWFDADGGLCALDAATAAMAPLLDWSEARQSAQVEAFRARRAADLAGLQAVSAGGSG
jgi:glycerol-3-phosphate dehydrogenase